MVKRLVWIPIGMVFIYACAFGWFFVHFHGYQIIPATIIGPLVCGSYEHMDFNNGSRYEPTPLCVDSNGQKRNVEMQYLLFTAGPALPILALISIMQRLRKARQPAGNISQP